MSAGVFLGDSVAITSGTAPVNNPGGIIITASSTLSADDQVTLTTRRRHRRSGTNSDIEATFSTTESWSADRDGNCRALRQHWSRYVHDGRGPGKFRGQHRGPSRGGLRPSDHQRRHAKHQQVTVGTGAKITALGNVNLTAGQDPTGQIDTEIGGQTDAQAYTEGAVGIPSDSATTTVASDTTLTINTGAQIGSGQNTIIGAYPGTPGAIQSGTARYAALGIPITTTSSSLPSATVASTVNQGGAITAGVFHTLNITIPNGGGAVQITPAPRLHRPGASTAAARRIQSARFHYAMFCNLGGCRARLRGIPRQAWESTCWDHDQSATTGGRPERREQAMPLYASGGDATVNGCVDQRPGTVTAYGGASINVTNQGQDYLLLGDIDVPNIPRWGWSRSQGRPVARESEFPRSTPGNSPSVSIDEETTPATWTLGADMSTSLPTAPPCS